MRHRHLAGAKAVDADLTLELVEPRIDLGVEIGDRHHHAVFALEAFGESFGDLHIVSAWVLIRLDVGRFAFVATACECWSVRRPEPNARGAGGGTRTPTTFVTGT